MEFSTPITRTKLLIPRRRENLLRRGRLLKALQDSAERRLTIVAAPAGYGKTSLLVDFASETMMPVCWYAIDELDADPLQFVMHFAAAIDVRFPGFAKTSFPALNAMPESRVSLDTIVALLVNDIYENIAEHFVIVIDDFHIVESSADVVYFINRFLMNVDENCHVFISSRKLLPLADLPLLVARAAVGGVGFEDLAFSLEEIQKLYAQNYEMQLNTESARHLIDKYEGWITGLLLSTEVVQGEIQERPQYQTVTGVSLYDYLAQQVLARQPIERQSFLFASSLLEEFDSALCAEIIGDEIGIDRDWDDDINFVLRNNLFAVVIGEGKPLLRYHHLFRDFLQSTFRQREPELMTRIQTRYVHHLKSIGEWERAHLLTKKMSAPELSAELVESIGQQMIINGKFKVVKQWLDELPESYRQKSPILNSIYGAAVLMSTDKMMGIEILTDSIDALSVMNKPEALAQALIRRTYGWRQLGQYEKSIADLDKAIEAMEQQGLLGSNLASAYHGKGATLLLMGRTNEAVTWLDESIRLYKLVGYEVGENKALMDYGMALNAVGRFAEAEKSYLKALQYYESSGNLVWRSSVLNNLGVLHSTLGEYETAIQELEASVQYSRIGDFYRAEAYALSSLGDIYLDVCMIEESSEAYQKAATVESQFHDHFLHFYLYYAKAQIYYHKGQSKTALKHIHIASKLAAESNSDSEKFYSEFLVGFSHLLSENYNGAISHLRNAYQLAQAQGMIPEQARCVIPVFIAELLAEDFENAERTMKQFENNLTDQLMVPIYSRYGGVFKMILGRKSHPSQFEPFVRKLIAFINQTHDSINSVRKALRAKSKLISLSPAQFFVRMFGRSQVKIGDHTITGAEWMSQNARDLLFLLMLHREGLTKEEIGGIFWPDLSPEELKLRFKNTIYRLRRAAGKDVIQFRDEIYNFNFDMDYEWDYESFQRLLDLSKKSKNPDEKINYLSEAVQLYQGEFLPDVFDDWAIAIRDEMQSTYLSALRELSALYSDQEEYENALQIGLKAIKLDPLYEPVVGSVMKAFAGMGDLSHAIEFYNQYKDNLFKTYSVQPSTEIMDAYQEISKKH